MLALERRNLILEKLQIEKRVVVSELSQLYGVSEETIRRDLEKLENDGLAIKSYGGAVINDNSNMDMPFNIRKNRNVAGKQRIAELAAKLVEDGDHIMLDASTTGVFIAKALKQKSRLTVVTNSLEAIIEMSDVSGWDIISTGGLLKEGYLALLGGAARAGVEKYCVDKLFLSCKGVSMEYGFMDSLEIFAEVKQSMIHASQKVYLAVDHSKFDQDSFCRIDTFASLSGVITDQEPEARWLKLFGSLGVECIYPTDKTKI
ncbi:MAG: DeoR/GlpR transcriptional regulator [Lachnospiraceae bacterium]|nr:DeoR/GlpR transcriptional regulator [Lachnospiraceae bacterium]